MVTVGIRELKSKASEILQTVREERARYTITHRGKPVAILLPIEEAPPNHANDKHALDALLALGNEIAAADTSGRSATEWLIENRR